MVNYPYSKRNTQPSVSNVGGVISLYHMPKEIERAWAAGFWDGEGHASVSKDGSTSFQVQQTELSILERFQRIVGCGKIYGPYEKPHKTQKPYWQLCFTSVGAGQQVFDCLQPYLYKTKREQFERTFAAINARRSKRVRKQLLKVAASRFQRRVNVAA